MTKYRGHTGKGFKVILENGSGRSNPVPGLAGIGRNSEMRIVIYFKKMT